MRWRGIRWSCSGRWCRSIGSAATTWRWQSRSPTHRAPQLIDANPTGETRKILELLSYALLTQML